MVQRAQTEKSVTVRGLWRCESETQARPRGISRKFNSEGKDTLFKRWIPWKFFVRRIARSYGFMDPFTFLARLRQFSQPSEVQEPLELLRAGIVFHARGLINTRAIQNNLDWIWPYWVEKQFNPEDVSFIPRAYSLTHVNLTHRNWTAVGQPDLPLYPLVDPRGLVTPFYDSWSLDVWLFGENDRRLLPSKLSDVHQRLEMGPALTVRTHCRNGALELTTRVWLELRQNTPFLIIRCDARSPQKGWLAVSLRPYNPEGIQFIEQIEYEEPDQTLKVNSDTVIHMNETPERVLFSNYEEGDVIHKLGEKESDRRITCDVGMASSLALFAMQNNQRKDLEIRLALDKACSRETGDLTHSRTWEVACEGTARLRLPDSHVCFLFEAAKRTLILLSAEEIYPGPYTYRRFWFRDACLMMNALLSLGLTERCFHLLDTFPKRQKRSGYFQSQEGEWDSNGQVLWAFDRFQRLTGQRLKKSWMRSVTKGAHWIRRKRTSKSDGIHGGLLPAGFSAEHLGPNDFYYWDNFWALAGLRSAARLASIHDFDEKERELLREAADFEATIIDTIRPLLKRTAGAVPASPYRRMDSGAVGSLAADYPLQITPAGDPMMVKTADFLLEHCVYAGGFFQDMIHSGINAYLTMWIAQTLLRAGDVRYRGLIERVGEMASATGQWPEAIHPLTGGGCMGDGQHGWAAAEWVQIVRNLFVREEEDKLILGSGLFPPWLQAPEDLAFGPTPTPFGDVSLKILKRDHGLLVEGDARWRKGPCDMEIRVPGYRTEKIQNFDRAYKLEHL